MRPATPAVRASALPAGPLVLALACALALSGGCARSPAPGAPAAHEAVLVRGGGPDPDSLDPQKARGFEAQSMLRDLCEGLTTLDRHGGGRPGRRDPLERERRRAHLHASSCAPRRAGRTATAWWRRTSSPRCGAWSTRPRPRATRSTSTSSPTPPTSSPAASPRRPSAWPPPMTATVVITPRHRRARTCRRCCRTRAPARCTGRRSPRTRTGFARPGVMVSNGAFVLSEWVQGAYVLARRNHHYWNDAATRLDAVKYLLIPDENAELTRYRGGELQVTFVVPRGQFDWIKAHLGAELHIAPQLTTYYYGFNLRRAPFKDSREAAPRAVAGHRPREARHARAARRRAARLRLGAARGRRLRVAVLRLPGRAHAAAHRRGAAAVPRGRLLAGSTRSPSSCATTPARCTPSSRSPSPRCGRRRSASRCA